MGRSSSDAPQARKPLPRAKRSLGQNFLVDDNIARKIAAALAITREDKVLEIGPGTGSLTRFLVEAEPGVLAAVERDPDLALGIKSMWPQIQVQVADGLTVDWARLDGWKIIGNLPYNVASPLMWDAVSKCRNWQRMVFMVQKEVGRRLAAKPSTKAYGALGVWAQSFARVDMAFTVSPQVFRPRPKVDSAVVVFTPLEQTDFPAHALSALLKRCFQMRRKQLRTTLRDIWTLEVDNYLDSQSLSPSSRPEELGPEQFQALSFLLQSAFPA
ncbi:MAG: ribosomal RNA small subunit methyltransferase A [Desulfovibrio sp.]|nr:MAG: ribosomal RNA small subunit methyltransferase A [Desulfovibrio sp.]